MFFTLPCPHCSLSTFCVRMLSEVSHAYFFVCTFVHHNYNDGLSLFMLVMWLFCEDFYLCVWVLSRVLWSTGTAPEVSSYRHNHIKCNVGTILSLYC